MFKWLLSLWFTVYELLIAGYHKLLTDNFVQSRYVQAGIAFSQDASWVNAEIPAGYYYYFYKWAKWEKIYAERGYRTYTVKEFFLHSEKGVPLENLGVKRDKGKPPILYSELGCKYYLGHKA